MRVPAYYLVSEAARRYRVTEETIRGLIRRGEIRAIRIGRAFRIPLSELERIEAPAA